jgi:hypothetical protein
VKVIMHRNTPWRKGDLHVEIEEGCGSCGERLLCATGLMSLKERAEAYFY